MERRDFVGAMLAVFCGAVLPEPLIESVRLIEPITLVKVPGEVQWTEDIDKMLKEIYQQPIMDMVITSKRVQEQLMVALAQPGEVLEGEPRYTDMSHYFELPPGWQVRSEGAV